MFWIGGHNVTVLLLSAPGLPQQHTDHTQPRHSLSEPKIQQPNSKTSLCLQLPDQDRAARRNCSLLSLSPEGDICNAYRGGNRAWGASTHALNQVSFLVTQYTVCGESLDKCNVFVHSIFKPKGHVKSLVHDALVRSEKICFTTW